MAARGARVMALAAALGSLAGCGFFGAEVREPSPTGVARMQVSSPDFAAGTPIPRRFTCEGRHVSPALAWSGVPPQTRALAVVVTDPDASGGTYVHWVLLNLDPTLRSLPAGAVPEGAAQARNSAGHARYDGPCPPSGTHRYRFSVYALRTPTTLPAVEAKATGVGTGVA